LVLSVHAFAQSRFFLCSAFFFCSSLSSICLARTSVSDSLSLSPLSPNLFFCIEFCFWESGSFFGRAHPVGALQQSLPLRRGALASFLLLPASPSGLCRFDSVEWVSFLSTCNFSGSDPLCRFSPLSFFPLLSRSVSAFRKKGFRFPYSF